MTVQRLRRTVLLLAFALLFGLATPRTAGAQSVRLGLGANYWLQETGLFDLTLAVGAPLTGSLSVGGRFGGFITTGSTPAFGIPIDLYLRAGLGRAYLEALGGPWIFLRGGESVRGHVAFGFGINGASMTFGPELAYLDPDVLIGVKLAFRL